VCSGPGSLSKSSLERDFCFALSRTISVCEIPVPPLTSLTWFLGTFEMLRVVFFPGSLLHVNLRVRTDRQFLVGPWTKAVETGPVQLPNWPPQASLRPSSSARSRRSSQSDGRGAGTPRAESTLTRRSIWPLRASVECSSSRAGRSPSEKSLHLRARRSAASSTDSS